MSAVFTARLRALIYGLGAAAAAVLIAAIPTSARAAAPMTEAAAEQIGLDAYDYGIPLLEFLRQQDKQTSVTVPDTQSDAPINQFGSARQLADPRHAVFVQPNNDTLYTMGHVDLSKGPIVLHVPAVPGHRYYSFEFLDPYTNVYNYVGTRTTGDGAHTWVITGPSFHGKLPHGLPRIRSHYQLTWLAGRTLVGDSSQLGAVHKIQDGYRLIPLAGYNKDGLGYKPQKPKRIVKTPKTFTEPTGVAFFDQLGTALADNPPPARDSKILQELKTVGVGPGLHPSQEHLSADVLAGLKAAADGGSQHVFALRLQIAAKSALAHNGWFVPPPDTGDYGTDYDFRAVVALNGLAANRPHEAIYIVGATDSTRALLNGANNYVFHFPAGDLPPAKYFWSLTMYDVNFYLVPNPINRYELASHTQGLKRNPDGSLDIYVQHTAPAGHQSNWLPSPASGQFEITLRLYGPEATALNDTYTYPPIVKTN
jgi:hypothetical protein